MKRRTSSTNVGSAWRNTLSARGPQTSQISAHTSAAGRPSARVFCEAEDRNVRIVIKKCRLGAPADPHRMLRAQDEADGSFQALWPLIDRAEWCPRPVERSDEPSELAS